MAGIRRQARITALQVLYELDCTKHKVQEALARLRAGGALGQGALGFTEELVKGVLQNKRELDALIKQFAPAFPA
jgi:N utilization substance protein B